MTAAPALPTAEGLRLIRLRQRRMLHLLLAFIPFVLVAGYLSRWPYPHQEIYFVLAAAAYGALLLGYSFRLAFTECPRCQGYYHTKSWLDPFTDRCLHCGLPLKTGA